MRRSNRSLQNSLLALAVVAAAGQPRVAVAQGVSQPDGASGRGPHFLVAPAGRGEPVRVDVKSVPTLRRTLSLQLEQARLDDALAEISQQAGLSLVYGDDVVPTDARVTLRAEAITVAAALTHVLLDAGVDVVFTRNGVGRIVPQPPLEPLPQVGTIVGTVTSAGSDAAASGPIAAAQVVVEDTGLGTLTDNDGRFSITDVPAGRQAVTVSSIGYRTSTQEVEVANGVTMTVDFVLDVAPTALNEIVVTATGPQRRVELGHVVGRIDAESVVREAPVNSLTDLISGRVAGVQVMHNSGLAGSTPRIRIRGLNSTGLSNDPIVVVDGVRVENRTGPTLFASTGAVQGGRLNDLNPEEIETLEVVKGPSASTLYGTDAANGVLVITTKRGRAGPARWRAWTEQGWATNSADEFSENYIAWGTTPTDATLRRCTLQHQAAGVCTIERVESFNPLNLDETSPFTTGRRQEYGLQVSGGSERLTYLLSGELSDEDGYVQMPAAEVARFESIHGAGTLASDFLRPNTQRQVGLRANLTAALGGRAEVRVGANYTGTRSRFVTDAAGNGVVAGAVLGPGFRDANNGYDDGGAPAVAFATTRRENADRFFGSLSGQWRPLSWLDARGIVGLDLIASDFSGLSRAGEGEIAAGRLSLTQLRTTTYTGDLGATATVPLTSRIRSETSVGVQYNRRDELQLRTQATGLPPGASGLGSLTGATTQRVTAVPDESYVLGGHVQEQVSLNDRLFLIGALRADGGSAFGDDVNLAAYPKASVSWLVSEEPFFPRWPVLTSLRLRAGWGASGVQPRRADVVPSYRFTTGVVDGQVATAAFLSAIGNPDLKPERGRELELGLDVELFDDRVSLEATYYNKVSKDALITIPGLPSSGGLGRLENVGSVRNRGVEGALRVAVLESRPLSWEVRVAGSYNQNRLLEAAPAISTLVGARPNFLHTPGFPIWGVWERELTFEDADDNGVITAGELQIGDTVFVGPSQPPRELTVASTVSILHGRLRIGTQLDYRGGHVRVDENEFRRCLLADSCRGLNDPTASLAEQAQALAALTPIEGGAVIRRIFDASFVRLRELGLTYIVGDRIARLFGGRQVSVTVGGRNLALWTDYPGPDPEATSSLFANSGDAFVDSGAFPQARSWTVRLQVGN